jgi:hypothetical protein
VIASAPAWVSWLSLGLWAFAFVVFGFVFVQALRFWRQVGPSIGPLLAMLKPFESPEPPPTPPPHARAGRP